MSDKIPVRVCSQADAEHNRHPRVFAHVGHRVGVICVAESLRAVLPDNYVIGILLHELGHLALMPGRHSERDADRQGGEIAGVSIRRRGWAGMGNLEYVSASDLPAARRVVYQLTDYRPLRGAMPWVIRR